MTTRTATWPAPDGSARSRLLDLCFEPGIPELEKVLGVDNATIARACDGDGELALQLVEAFEAKRAET